MDFCALSYVSSLQQFVELSTLHEFPYLGIPYLAKHSSNLEASLIFNGSRFQKQAQGLSCICTKSCQNAFTTRVSCLVPTISLIFFLSLRKNVIKNGSKNFLLFLLFPLKNHIFKSDMHEFALFHVLGKLGDSSHDLHKFTNQLLPSFCYLFIEELLSQLFVCFRLLFLCPYLHHYILSPKGSILCFYSNVTHNIVQNFAFVCTQELFSITSNI